MHHLAEFHNGRQLAKAQLGDNCVWFSLLETFAHYTEPFVSVFILETLIDTDLNLLVRVHKNVWFFCATSSANFAVIADEVQL